VRHAGRLSPRGHRRNVLPCILDGQDRKEVIQLLEASMEKVLSAAGWRTIKTYWLYPVS
jgi:hypothetical protein